MSFKYHTTILIVLLSFVLVTHCANNDNEQQAAELDSGEQPAQQQMQQQQNALDQQLNQTPDIELSDGELQQFADVVEHLQGIQQQARTDMLNAIEEEGLDANRYSQIMKSQQNPQSTIEVSEEEMEQFEAASEEIQAIEKDMRSNSVEAIEEEGFTPERFQTVLMAVRNTPELQQRLEQMN